MEFRFKAGQLEISTEVPYITSLISDIQNAGDAAEGSISFAGWISTADTPGNAAFVRKYRAKYGSEPNAWTAQSHAAVHIVAAAIAEAQSTDPSAIRDALANTKDFDTVLGAFSFKPLSGTPFTTQLYRLSKAVNSRYLSDFLDNAIDKKPSFCYGSTFVSVEKLGFF